MQLKGRHFVIGWTAVFLLAAGVVVTRLKRSFEVTERLQVLQASIDSLHAEKAEPENALGPLKGEALRIKAQGLGLRDASDSELVTLILPPPR